MASAAEETRAHEGGGRPRDGARQDAIRGVAQEILAEVGYDRLTVDAVAARAHASKATLYRRWPSKADLVVDAVGCLAPGADPPDTGSLASDLRSLLESKETLDGFRLGLMRGVLSALPRHPDLAQVFRERFVAQRARMLRGLFERAASRGEIPKDRDLDLLASVFPAMLCHRAFVAGQPVDLPYLRRVVEHILLPLATAQGATARPNDPIARPPSAAEATAAKDRPACP